MAGWEDCLESRFLITIILLNVFFIGQGMVRLFGCVHGLEQFSSWGNYRKKTLQPQEDLIEEIHGLPSGTRVGIECLVRDDWEVIRENLNGLHEDAGLTVPVTMQYDFDYWEKIYYHCGLSGHEIVLLEDPANMLKHNQAMIEWAKVEEKYKSLFHERGESDREYFEKLLKLNQERIKSVLLRRKVHEIERDNLFLETIKSEELEAVFCGTFHTDYWAANQHLDVEQYSKEEITSFPNGGFFIKFFPEAEPNPQVAYDRESLERSLRLLETGRVVADRTPDYIGTWSRAEPSEGYFEMFIESQDELGNISGTIEDCLGTAEFKGKRTSGEFTFVKEYVDFKEGAVKDPMHYEALNYQNSRDSFCGQYIAFRQGQRVDGGGFCMIKAPQMDPIELGLVYYDLNQELKEK